MMQHEELDRYEVHDRCHGLLLKKVNRVIFLQVATPVWSLFNNLEVLARRQVKETHERRL